MSYYMKKILNNRIAYFIYFVILAFLDTCTLLPVELGVIKRDYANADALRLDGISALLFILFIMLSAKLYKKIVNTSSLLNRFKHLFPTKMTQIGIIFLGIFGMFFMNIITALLIKLTSSAPTSTNQSAINTVLKSQPDYMWGMILCSVLLAPILEELLYRGILMHLVSPKLSYISVLASGIVFAIMHQGFTLVSFISYCGFGIILALVYKYTHSLSTSIITHAGYNLITYLPIILAFI